MNPVSMQAFSDELVKIALLGEIMRAGWDDPDATHHPLTPKALRGWVGTGPEITPAMRAPGKWNAIRRGWQQVSGLGGLTRFLPVGPKSLMVAGTVPLAIDALRRDDPTGQNRSRLQRVSSLGGETLGGVFGTGLANKYAPKSMIGSLAGFIGGSMLGSHLANMPFRQRPVAQPPVQEAQPMAESTVAPGAV